MTQYETIQAALGRDHPELWATLYPRAYRDAGAWHSPKIAATMLGAMVHSARSIAWDALPPSARQAYLVAAQCAAHAMPTYFVARQLLEAVARTTPPPNLAWTDLHLPHPGLTLMLPRGTLRHEREGEIGAICLARVPALERIAFPATDCPERRLREDVLIAVGCAHEWPTMPLYDLTLNAATTPTLGGIADITTGTDVRLDPQTGEPRAEPTTLADAQVAQSLMSLALRLVLVMSARPELVEPGVQTGRQTKRDTGLTYWSPTIVGRAYRTRIESDAPHGTHASPRLHWRRGHYAAQAHGPGFTLRKIIWREPVLVAATLP